MRMTSAQCRAARGLLNWSQTDLADRANVSRATITSFEAEKRTPIDNNILSIVAAFEAGGVEFIPKGQGGEGVRLREAVPPFVGLPFPVFEIALSFGLGRFGVWREDSDYNRWSSLTLIQMANPNREFINDFDDSLFWIEVLSDGNALQRVLRTAIDSVDGPRKPQDPSQLYWSLYQPDCVYPNANKLHGQMRIDWKKDPPALLKESTSFVPRLDRPWPRLPHIDWYLFDD